MPIHYCQYGGDIIQTWGELIEVIKQGYERLQRVGNIEKESLWPEIEERLAIAKVAIDADIDTKYDVEIQDIIGIKDEFAFLHIERIDTV